MSKKKSDKIAKILANTALGNEMTIAVGNESFTLGELREMDEETEGGSTAELDALQRDIEQRESTLVAAQNNTMTFLQSVAESLGVPFDDFIGAAANGKVDGLKLRPKGKIVTPSNDEEGLEGLDDATKSAVVAARKILAPEINRLKTELTETKKALGIGLNTYLDTFYEDIWEKLEPTVPKGKDGKPLVKLSLKEAMKYAQDNKLMDARGRLDLRKTFKDMTADARTQLLVQEAEERGAKRKEDEIAAASMTRPGPQARPAHLTAPPTVKEGNHERTKTFDEVLADARNDTEIWKQALSGGGFGSA